jgi:hypothetical protein
MEKSKFGYFREALRSLVALPVVGGASRRLLADELRRLAGELEAAASDQAAPADNVLVWSPPRKRSRQRERLPIDPPPGWDP